jgi:hypothetical protein
MYAFMQPYLTPDITATFKAPYAETFYEGFRGMVKAQMNEYWYQLTMAAKAKESAANQPQQEQPAQPQQEQPASDAEVPVEPAGDGATPEEPAEPIVVPESRKPPRRTP